MTKKFWNDPCSTHHKAAVASVDGNNTTLNSTIFFAFSGGQESDDDEPNERRYWEIEGYARVPRGGTHVRSTSEIGPIRLKRDNIGKGKERVQIYPVEPTLSVLSN